MNVVQTLTGRRSRNRAVRHEGYLATALRIATEEGLHAVTMQRLAAELDCAVGTVYTYFPSKSALVAEVQQQAIERLTRSFGQLRAELDDVVADEASAVQALTRVVAVARFWINIGRVYPQETRLLQLLMSQGEQALSPEDVVRVAPGALRHLELAREAIAAAIDSDALSPGIAMDRTVTLVAAINGVLQVGRLAHLDPVLLDGERLAAALVDDLLRGWGADLGRLAAAHTHVDALAARGPLARPIPETDQP
ncbi:MAG TPA: helix-turn-helix domain-containing protein [Acidimicrobiales bacterium]|nr:helix-turn-helix domain-containing protein [Acidimicrobiales bacterium]